VVNLAVGTFVPDRWIVRGSCTHSSLGSLFAATRPGGDFGEFGMSLIPCLRGLGLFIDVCDLSHIVRAGRLNAEIHTEVFQMMCNVC